MKSPFDLSLGRILLVNFDGLSVYSLDGEKLTHVARFSDDESGFDNFQFYLSEHKKTPVTILIDSVSEDFVVENVAHTGPLDRAALLKRKLDQNFRGAEYKSARVLGRAEKGRKDDRVLFSALTKSQGIEPWVKVLLAESVPIQSITTPAYALCKVAKQYELMTSKSILLVNWEKSGIRQTLIEEEKVMFSRLTPLPTYGFDKPAGFIMDTCQQSKEYLERIGLLAFDALIDVHIITPHLDNADFLEFEGSRNFNLIKHHNSIDMYQIDKFSGAQSEITGVLLCLDWGIRTGGLNNIYAPSWAQRFYHLKQARRLVYTLAVSAMLLGILVSAPVMYGAYERSINVEVIRQQLYPVQNNYDDLTAQFPETPIPSDAMALAVGTFNSIEAQMLNPSEILGEVGRVLARHSSINLTSLDWNYLAADGNEEITDSILQNDMMLDVRLYGVIGGANSLQESHLELNNLIRDLSMIPNVSVSTIAQPIETSTDAEIVTILHDQKIDAEFALSVKRES